MSNIICELNLLKRENGLPLVAGTPSPSMNISHEHRGEISMMHQMSDTSINEAFCNSITNQTNAKLQMNLNPRYISKVTQYHLQLQHINK